MLAVLLGERREEKMSIGIVSVGLGGLSDSTNRPSSSESNDFDGIRLMVPGSGSTPCSATLDGHRRVATQQLCHHRLVVGRQMLDHDERDAAVIGHLGEEPLERFEPPAGTPIATIGTLGPPSPDDLVHLPLPRSVVTEPRCGFRDLGH
ncbi:MAG: hypothetical protein R2713_23830 [Ilumatobacteraceae bacterium]